MKTILLIFQFFICKILFSQLVQDSIHIDKLNNEIKDQQFSIFYSYKTLPKFIKKGIKKIEGKKFIAADKNQEYNSTDVVIKSSLPNKRILYIASSNNIYIITYEQGGFGREVKSKIVNFSYRKVGSIKNLSVPFHESVDELKFILTKKIGVHVIEPY